MYFKVGNMFNLTSVSSEECRGTKCLNLEQLCHHGEELLLVDVEDVDCGCSLSNQHPLVRPRKSVGQRLKLPTRVSPNRILKIKIYKLIFELAFFRRQFKRSKTQGLYYKNTTDW